jgi:hypothetical protein
MRARQAGVRRGVFRGKKRAFERAIARAERDAASLVADPSGWWNMWHYHADWRGWGNLSWKYRRRYLEALVIMYKRIATIGPSLSTPFQSWIMLSENDAGGDATFLHTPNPYGTPFPATLGVIRWDRTLPEAGFERLLPEFPLRIGLSEWRDDSDEDPLWRMRRSWVVYSPAVGVPLEGNDAVEQGDEADEAR